MVHPFNILQAHYVYILTPLTKNKVVVEAVGYTKAKANANFKRIKCSAGYKDCFNFLLTQNRVLEVWSDNPKVRSVRYIIKKGDENEQHKHPISFAQEISKGESFDWFYKTEYFLRQPSEEIIEEVRRKNWWDSRAKPIFIFFWDVKSKLSNIKIDFYVPTWLAQYEFSKTYKNIDFDSKPLNESKLKKLGITINRQRKYTKIKEPLTKHLAHFHRNTKYYCSSVRFNSQKNQRTPITITVGFLMPRSKKWKL